MPTKLQFSDAEISTMATVLGIDLSSPEKIAVLKASESCDVQAGPGCGKTTILTAKLALLAEKWRWPDRGVLVLSHTNVARREIESRLGLSKPLAQLLGYPHFIGTFQTFVDQLLAIPFLRQEGKEITAVDNDKFTARALASFGSHAYSKAQYALKNRQEGLETIIGGLRYEGSQLSVTNPAANNLRFPGPASATGQQLKLLKERLSEAGYFRFDDMYAYAEACLDRRRYLLSIIRRRFPWIFVDELQDTNETQDRILETMFGADECIMQKFGDKNQAIFNFDGASDAAPELFGRRPTLPLSETHRFGDEIARFASMLTVIEPQTLRASAPKVKCRHTIFIYDRAAISKVVPAFAELVLSQVPESNRKRNGVCVVGGRKNVKQPNPKNFPESIGDYWQGFSSDISRKPKKPDSFYGFVTDARSQARKDHSYAEAAARITSGVLEAIRRASLVKTKPLVTSRTELNDHLKAAGLLTEFRKLLWDLLRPDADLSETAWPTIMTRMAHLLASIVPAPHNIQLLAFLAWGDSQAPSCIQIAPGHPIIENVLPYVSAKGITTPIRFDSIHGVKGETHTATLIVETFSRSHDLKSLISVLAGTQKASELAATAINHCKRTFVGMTRPTDLVCLAIFADHIDAKKVALLEKAGWHIQHVKA